MTRILHSLDSLIQSKVQELAIGFYFFWNKDNFAFARFALCVLVSVVALITVWCGCAVTQSVFFVVCAATSLVYFRFALRMGRSRECNKVLPVAMQDQLFIGAARSCTLIVLNAASLLLLAFLLWQDMVGVNRLWSIPLVLFLQFNIQMFVTYLLSSDFGSIPGYHD